MQPWLTELWQVSVELPHPGLPRDDRNCRQRAHRPASDISSHPVPLGPQPELFTYSNEPKDLLYIVNSLKQMHYASVLCMYLNFPQLLKYVYWWQKSNHVYFCQSLLLSLPPFVSLSSSSHFFIRIVIYYTVRVLWVDCLHAHTQPHYLGKTKEKDFKNTRMVWSCSTLCLCQFASS